MVKPRAVVFDLDDTLYPVSSVPVDAIAPVIAAVRRANAGPDAIPSERLELALADAWRHPFPVVTALHALPPAVIAAWHEAQLALEVTGSLEPFADVRRVLPRLTQQRFLVTTGYRRFQESKVAALGIADLFDGIYIDALDVAGGAHGKTAVFRHLMDIWKLTAREIVVVGDSERGEIAAGQSLGMPTVQVLRPGVTRARLVDWHVSGLEELPALIERIAIDP
jgi:putative hydrolase of the HAD superfamily